MQENNRMRIKITMGSNGRPALRQLPKGIPQWKDCDFFINDESIKECDVWVVWGPLQKTEACQASHTIFFAAEPPSVYRYQKSFLKQFDTVITSDTKTKHPHALLIQQSLPWWIGHKMSPSKKDILEHTYDELSQVTSYPEKHKELSLVISNKSATQGHKDRLTFALNLKEHFGNRLDFYGKGFNEINDKWDVISPYKYHIALENTSLDNYWTEKLADPLLVGAHTFYYGCPNVYDYFPKGAITQIDIYKPEEAISLIEKVLSENVYKKSQEALLECKELVLNKYQLFPAIYQLAHTLTTTTSNKKEYTLRPESVWYRYLTKLWK